MQNGIKVNVLTYKNIRTNAYRRLDDDDSMRTAVFGCISCPEEQVSFFETLILYVS